jgi:hypothetical protein
MNDCDLADGNHRDEEGLAPPGGKKGESRAAPAGFPFAHQVTEESRIAMFVMPGSKPAGQKFLAFKPRLAQHPAAMRQDILTR